MKKVMKEKVTTKDDEGNEVILAIKRPSPKVLNDSQSIYNQTFRKSLESGALLRQKLEDVLKEQKIWDDEKEVLYKKINKNISENEKKLKKGGVRLSEARQLALALRQLREERRELLRERNSLDANTAEAQAESERFNYLVSVCTVYDNTGKRVYEDYDDYLNSADSSIAVDSATKLANMLYGLDSDYEYNLTENRFLKKYNFVDDKLRLINSDGHLVDNKGRLINEDGRFIDKDGNFVDIYGDPVDEEGEYVVEFSPFLDDNDKPVVDEEEEKPKKSRGRPKKDS